MVPLNTFAVYIRHLQSACCALKLSSSGKKRANFKKKVFPVCAELSEHKLDPDPNSYPFGTDNWLQPNPFANVEYVMLAPLRLLNQCFRFHFLFRIGI